jgi:hypothetical protein
MHLKPVTPTGKIEKLMRPHRLITLTVCAAVAAVALTGCSNSTKGADKSSSSASGSSAASSSAALTQDTLPPASSIVNDIDKRKDVTVAKCAATADGWGASGTVKNSGTADATYAITIFFTNDHATVEDYATATVSAKAGASADWTAAQKFAATTPTNCVLRGVG